MKILTTTQLRELDAYTIAHKPIKSFSLMRIAAIELVQAISGRLWNPEDCLFICGPGNNGGDGLLMAAAIAQDSEGTDQKITVWRVMSGEFSENNKLALKSLSKYDFVRIVQITDTKQIKAPKKGCVVVDAIYGSGLSRPLNGLAKDVVKAMNTWPNEIISIDVPSGMMGEDNIGNDPSAIVQADQTLTIHAPKLAFLLCDVAAHAGSWNVVDIGLQEKASGIESPFRLIEQDAISEFLPARQKFSHKGTYGHVLVMAGSEGKMGAARLCARAALKSGAGSVTASVPKNGLTVMQTGEPEVMCIRDQEAGHLTRLPDLIPFNAVACGPGIATRKETATLVRLLIQECREPLVLDADALNILGENRTWLHFLPRGTVLTPHPKEFDRMFGSHSTAFKRLTTQREQAIKLGVVIVLKGANTSVALPDGTVHFNCTGNPGMATAGSGDVLTGIIAGLLAQGLNSGAAAMYAVHLHGLAGDEALKEQSEQSLIASDLINQLGNAFNRISGSRASD